MPAQRFLAQPMKVIRVLWAALTLSNVLLGVMILLNHWPKQGTPEGQLLVILYVSALGGAVASFVVPRILHAKSLSGVRVEVFPGEPGPTGASSGGRFAQPQAAARRAFAIAFQPFIVSMALSETVSLVGLCVRAMGGPQTTALALVAIGTTLAAWRFPSPTRLLAPFERKHDATFAASEGGSY
ncbi:MAG: hypothetical protein ABSE49_28360 [Polyangiaceae bacterium]|jgi:hypothetical protein